MTTSLISLQWRLLIKLLTSYPVNKHLRPDPGGSFVISFILQKDNNNLSRDDVKPCSSWPQNRVVAIHPYRTTGLDLVFSPIDRFSVAKPEPQPLELTPQPLGHRSCDCYCASQGLWLKSQSVRQRCFQWFRGVLQFLLVFIYSHQSLCAVRWNRSGALAAGEKCWAK